MGEWVRLARSFGFAALVAVTGVAALSAQTTATQLVTFRVEPIARISVQGTPSLVISTAVAGSSLTSATASATWAVTTNQTGAKVTVSIAEDMPAGVTLSASLAAPVGATSTGLKALGTTPVDLITNLTQVRASDLSITYQLDAVPTAVLKEGSRVVTFTITGGV